MIKIFSTYTKDEIDNQDKNLKIIRNGGPAFFIENIFKKNKIKYKMISQKAVIKIEIKNGIEEGILKNKLREKKIKNIKNDDIIIISTVDKEWLFCGKFLKKAIIFLDVQGYVRAIRKNKLICKSDFWNNIFCIKGNEHEIRWLPKNVIKNQKRKCLIVTKGVEGAVVYLRNKKYILNAKKVKPEDTIGAGDTFFAGFIAGFIRNNGDIVKSGKFAIKEAENLLLTKQKYK